MAHMTAFIAMLLLLAPPDARTMYDFPVPGHGSATIVPPTGADPRPLIVFVHGSWDRPEWLCEMMDRTLEGAAWLLCLRGTLRAERPPDGARWTVGRPEQTLAELNAAETALRARFGDRISPGIAAIGGFSKGTWHVVTMARGAPARFPAILLMEGGHGALDKATIRALGAARTRVALACGTRSCTRTAVARCRGLEKAGAPCRSAVDLDVGHSYNPPFERLGAPLLRWLLDSGNP